MNPPGLYVGDDGYEKPGPAFLAGTRLMKTLAAIKKNIRESKAILRDRYHVRRIGIFGSYARGNTHSGSDVDVLVEFSEPVSLIQLVSLENFLSGVIGIKVDVVPKEDIRRELKEAILKDAVYL